ncbi:MAG: ribonuclease [Glaciihabitans sp.]|nr:ribonuclease [Glaciihabitans sp.]
MTIRAAADGSALGNPGPAGWAWYVDDTCWAAGGWKHATNNQGELMAVLQLFRATAHLDDDLHILCDSQYVINAVTKWMPGWKKKGWKKADGKPVMNLDLLKDIDAALIGRKYRFEWVKGHANHPLNEAADSRARAVSEAYQRGKPIPSGPGWVRNGDASPRPPLEQPASNGTVGATSTGSLSAEPTQPVVVGGVAAARAAKKAAAAASEAPSLFDFDEPQDKPQAASTAPLTVALTPAQRDRLAALARRSGKTPEQALADLIP